MKDQKRYTISVGRRGVDLAVIGTSDDLQEAVDTAIEASKNKELALSYVGVEAKIWVWDNLLSEAPLTAQFRRS